MEHLKRIFLLVVLMSMVSMSAIAHDVDAVDTERSTVAEPEVYAVLSSDGKTVTFYYDTEKDSRGGVDMLLSNYNSVETAVFDDSFAAYRPTSTAGWFSGCENLTTIIGLNKLNTSEVTDMFGMFSWSNALTSLDLSSFNTSNVTNMNMMFAGCSSLTSLDLSSFNTWNVEIMSAMFQWSEKLTTIYVSKRWNTSSVTSGEVMFSGCTGLIGGEGTAFDDAHLDYSYAHVDGGTADPGYFTS